MTREEILAMEPGRELDTLIAKYVMELTLYTKCRSSYKPWCGAKKCYFGCKVIQCAKDMPSYSTDIAAAWEVVEKMCKDGWRFFVEGDRDGLFASFTRNNVHYLQKGETAPEAIVKAALLAVIV